jgi:hypothetical protein
MLNDRLAAAKMVAEKLFALEEAIDAALICAGELAAVAPKARKRANLSAVVGQDAIALTGETLAALYAARAHIIGAHDHFAVVRDQIGIKPNMTGDLWKFVGKQEDENVLRSVA